MASPFLKWAGGKGRLLPELLSRMPNKPNGGFRYLEPFIGGGAFFFYLEENEWLHSAKISDINPELVLCYNTIKFHVNMVVSELEMIAKNFPKKDATRARFFYKMRERWNRKLCTNIDDFNPKMASKRVALTIFLNKTCFNGLFRVNSKGRFNVPYGRYKNPNFVNKTNLKEVSKALQSVEISCKPYQEIELDEEGTFVYFDPPYRPLTTSSSFTSYSKSGFNDSNQIELAEFVQSISSQAKVMLSNSDPKNSDATDDFFDILYSDFTIHRIQAARSINSDGKKRGKISEILVTNY
jgi:DNA adenine methylase